MRHRERRGYDSHLAARVALGSMLDSEPLVVGERVEVEALDERGGWGLVTKIPAVDY